MGWEALCAVPKIGTFTVHLSASTRFVVIQDVGHLHGASKSSDLDGTRRSTGVLSATVAWLASYTYHRESGFMHYVWDKPLGALHS